MLFYELTTSHAPSPDPVLILNTLDALSRLNVHEAADHLTVLVDSRYFVREFPGDQLHGFALQASQALGVLDSWKTWTRERVYRDYAPLAFSFLRDTRPEKLPCLINEVASLGFLNEALESIVDSGSESSVVTLTAIFRQAGAPGESAVPRQLATTLQQLNLEPYLSFQLLKALGELPTPHVVISLGAFTDLANALVSELATVGIDGQLMPDVTLAQREAFASRRLLIADGDSFEKSLQYAYNSCQTLAIYSYGQPSDPLTIAAPQVAIASVVEPKAYVASTISRRVCQLYVSGWVDVPSALTSRPSSVGVIPLARAYGASELAREWHNIARERRSR
jgi:hypothetical protein